MAFSKLESIISGTERAIVRQRLAAAQEDGTLGLLTPDFSTGELIRYELPRPPTVAGWSGASSPVFVPAPQGDDGIDVSGIIRALSLGSSQVVARIFAADGSGLLDLSAVIYGMVDRVAFRYLTASASDGTKQISTWAVPTGGATPTVSVDSGLAVQWTLLPASDYPTRYEDIPAHAADTLLTWVEPRSEAGIQALDVLGTGGAPIKDVATIRARYDRRIRNALQFTLDGQLYRVQSRRTLGNRRQIEFTGERIGTA